MEDIEKARKELEYHLGTQKIQYDDFILSSYSKDSNIWVNKSYPPTRPSMVALPDSTEEVKEIVRLANIYKIPIIATGGRLSGWGAFMCDGAIQLDSSNMNKIIEIDLENMSFTAQAGIGIDQIDIELRKKGFTYYVHPTHAAPKGLGSEVCKCTFGANKSMWGHITKRILGLEIVLGNGDVLQTGATRVIKNTASFLQSGIPDLTQLFVASEGAYGVITEVSQHMVPLPLSSGYIDAKTEPTMAGFKKIMNIAQEIRSKYLADTMCIADIYATWRSFRGLSRASGEDLDIDEKTALKQFGHTLTIDFDSFYSQEDCKLKEKNIREIIAKHKGEVVEDQKFGKLVSSIDNPFTYGDAFDQSCFHAATRPWGYIWGEVSYSSNTKLYKKCLEIIDECNWPTKDFYYVSILTPESCASLVITYVDISNRKAIGKWKEINKKILKSFVDIGVVPSRTGRIWRPYFIQQLDPSYYKYIMKIKKIFDPNNIMNPGVSVFGETYE